MNCNLKYNLIEVNFKKIKKDIKSKKIYYLLDKYLINNDNNKEIQKLALNNDIGKCFNIKV